jgi:N-carbamoyl-L-amino-acid hydrolase
MMFVQSLRGISHNRIEDTSDDHLSMAIIALDNLADRTIDWIVSQP